MKKVFSSDVTRIAISLILLILAVILEQYANTYVALTVYLLTLALCGYRVFADAIRGIIRRDLLDEKFLMSIASIGAMIVGEWSEGVAVMLFYLVGESFEKCFGAKLKKYAPLHVYIDSRVCRFTPSGMFVSNYILSDVLDF